MITLNAMELIALVMVVASASACFGLVAGVCCMVAGRADEEMAEIYEAESERRL